MLIHIAYITIILILAILLLLVFLAHTSNSNKLIKVNCLVAEMMMDNSRFCKIKFVFEGFINDKNQPIHNNRPPTSQSFEENYNYWIFTATQLEKATEMLLTSEEGGNYQSLAKTIHEKMNVEK